LTPSKDGSIVIENLDKRLAQITTDATYPLNYMICPSFDPPSCFSPREGGSFLYSPMGRYLKIT